MYQLTLPGDFTVPDPIAQGNGKISSAKTIGDIVFQAIPYVMAIAGLVLFVMLIFGGFTLLTSVGNQEAVAKGKGMITSALIGFAIIFCAYWLMQILEIMLGLKLGFGG